MRRICRNTALRVRGVGLAEQKVISQIEDGKAEAKSEAGELTSEEAAKLLHVSRTHLNTLIDEGKLDGVRYTQGGHRRIQRAAVLAYRGKTKIAQEKGA